MKKLRIWINSFTLIQQYIVVSLVSLFIFVLFVVQYLSVNIDNFTNQQMFSYLHRSQVSYIAALETKLNYDDANVSHFIYDSQKNTYREIVDEKNLAILIKLDPLIEGDIYDGVLDDDNIVIYSIKKYGNNYIVSILNGAYRSEFRQALISGVLNSSLISVLVVFICLMLWIYSLIYPLNSIRNYIFKWRNGENAKLVVKRNDEIGEVAEALIEMNEELDKQKHIREEMIQNISHDLKTPIATIKSYSESIKDGVYPYGTLEKSVDVIYEHANRLEKKVYSLIAFNKIGYLEDTLEGDNLLMAPVINKAIISCEVLRNDVQIDTSEVEEEVYFHGDEEAWRTVVENLLDNGLRYANSMIKITLSNNLLEVSNDGEQMPKERIEKLFKPYEKGNKGNFGLGLSIVKRVCDTYGYTVVGENRNDGVVFRIYRNLRV